MGQGAAQAIEDGCALGVLLPADTPPEEIPQRLELWQQCRMERAHKIVEYTRHRSREADGSQGPPQTSKLSSVLLPLSSLNGFHSRTSTPPDPSLSHQTIIM